MGAGMAFHGWDLWVELTGGISDQNSWQIDAVDFQKFIESLMVILFPNWLAIGGKN